MELLVGGRQQIPVTTGAFNGSSGQSLFQQLDRRLVLLESEEEGDDAEVFLGAVQQSVGLSPLQGEQRTHVVAPDVSITLGISGQAKVGGSQLLPVLAAGGLLTDEQFE